MQKPISLTHTHTYNRCGYAVVERAPHPSQLLTRDWWCPSLQVLLTKFTDHPKVPRSNDFMRSEIILGVTEVRPHPSGRPDRVVFTTVSHVKSAGVPAFMADKFSVKGVVDFVDNMEAVLKGEARRGQ